ncbi:hypothetical protein BDN72DRAFT_902325 [Pluteus cervinus]|uniref:Uncharacterized protein n=1 Tax=Pluteus cervinus TaxID=181527 RepID=A0ACD3ACA5_9AGAR|nr:hypothetical protein BDN72DRAFT_902325 [Pluteus cervinus]
MPETFTARVRRNDSHQSFPDVDLKGVFLDQGSGAMIHYTSISIRGKHYMIGGYLRTEGPENQSLSSITHHIKWQGEIAVVGLGTRVQFLASPGGPRDMINAAVSIFMTCLIEARTTGRGVPQQISIGVQYKYVPRNLFSTPEATGTQSMSPKSSRASVPKGEPPAPALPQGAPIHRLKTSGRPPVREDFDVLRTNFADQGYASDSGSQASASDLEYRLNEDVEDDKSFLHEDKDKKSGHRKDDDNSFHHDDDKSVHREKSAISSTPHFPGRYVDSAKKPALEQDNRRVRLPETPLKPAMKHVVLQGADVKQVRHAAHASSVRETPPVQAIRTPRSISPEESTIRQRPRPASMSNENHERSNSRDVSLPDLNQLSILGRPNREPETPRRNTDALNVLFQDAEQSHPSHVGLEMDQLGISTGATATQPTHVQTNGQVLPPFAYQPPGSYGYGHVPSASKYIFPSVRESMIMTKFYSEVPAYGQAIDSVRSHPSWNTRQVLMHEAHQLPPSSVQSQYPYSVPHPNPSNQVMYTAPFPPATYPAGIAPGSNSGSMISGANPRRGRNVTESIPPPPVSQSRAVDAGLVPNFKVTRGDRVYEKDPKNQALHTVWFESEGPLPLQSVPEDLIALGGHQVKIGDIYWHKITTDNMHQYWLYTPYRSAFGTAPRWVEITVNCQRRKASTTIDHPHRGQMRHLGILAAGGPSWWSGPGKLRFD